MEGTTPEGDAVDVPSKIQHGFRHRSQPCRTNHVLETVGRSWSPPVRHQGRSRMPPDETKPQPPWPVPLPLLVKEPRPGDHHRRPGESGSTAARDGSVDPRPRGPEPPLPEVGTVAMAESVPPWPDPLSPQLDQTSPWPDLQTTWPDLPLPS